MSINEIESEEKTELNLKKKPLNLDFQVCDIQQKNQNYIISESKALNTSNSFSSIEPIKKSKIADGFKGFY